VHDDDNPHYDYENPWTYNRADHKQLSFKFPDKARVTSNVLGSNVKVVTTKTNQNALDSGWLSELREQLESTLQQILDRLDELEDRLSSENVD
jgi:hypothetical protein